MSRNPDGEKRRRILDAAFKSFCEVGYKATTIKKIADSAKIAQGSLYTYFEDKNALYEATIEDMWASFFSELNKIKESKNNFLDDLASIYDQATSIIFMSHNLLNDMFTNKSRKELLRANLNKTSTILAEQFIARPGDTVIFNNDVTDLSQRIEIFLFGAFLQLALCSKTEFHSLKNKIKKTVFQIISGTCV